MMKSHTLATLASSCLSRLGRRSDGMPTNYSKKWGGFAAVVGALAALAGPAMAQSPAPVVISQVYGGGNNSGAVYRHDFVELFNRSCVPVDISTWSLQQASVSGTSWTRTNIPAGTVLQPGQYFLMQFTSLVAGGTPVGAELPAAPDAYSAQGSTGSNIGIAAANGKIALVRNQSALASVACPNSTFSNGVVDMVTFGTGGSACEGAVVPTITSAQSILRNTVGCSDTNVNSADFTIQTATTVPPRNMFTTLAPCGGTGTLGFGACNVAATGLCFVLNSTDCTTAGGTFSECTPCAPRGACCTGNGVCSITFPAECTVAAGSFAGSNTTCYTVAAGTNAIETIPSPTTGPTGDDGVSTVIALPFTFVYFGVNQTQVSYNTNGLVVFGAATSSAFNDLRFPNSTTPNNALSALWDDLNVDVSASTQHGLVGIAPNRRFVITWNNDLDRSTGGARYTFQVALLETSNQIEFRYGTFTQGVTQGDFSIGLENSTGNVGQYRDARSITSNSSLTWDPSACPLAAGACCIGSICSSTNQVACANQSGSYQGNNVSCAPDPCISGACCQTSGTCSVGFASSCIASGGIYQGDNEVCGTTACPSLGACCVTSTCTVTFQANCMGTWTVGDATSCTVNPCIGACCANDGTCSILTSAQCTGFRWTSAGSCTPINFCTGSCCPSTPGLCSVVTQANCAGSYGGDGSSCTVNSTSQDFPQTTSLPLLVTDNTPGGVTSVVSVAPSFTIGKATVSVSIPAHTFVGDLTVSISHNGGTPVVLWGRACSTFDNLTATFDDAGATYSTCANGPQGTIKPTSGTVTAGLLSAFNGQNSSGTWTLFASDSVNGDVGSIVSWSVTLTPQYATCVAACCVGNSCSSLSESDCVAASGSYLGAGNSCSPNPCTPPGACCSATGVCTFLPVASCTGTFVAEGQACSPTTFCMGACILPVASCSVLSTGDCTAASGTFAGYNTTCSYPTGACCQPSGSCSITVNTGPGATCSSLGGTYQNDGATCGSVTYSAPTTPSVTIENITATGSPLTFSDVDDGFAAVTLPFTFNYYGASKTTASVGVNGHITFTGTAGAFTNVTIPAAAVPNDAIYALWDDLYLRNATSRVITETRGTSPNRRFIMQWDRVQHRLDTGPTYPEMTFQVVLYETANAIAIRYGTIQSATNITATIGLENSAGTVATSIAQATVTGGNVSKVFIPSGLTCPTPSGACCASTGCTLITYAACIAAGGEYQGDNSACPITPGSVAATPSHVCPTFSSQLTASVGAGEVVEWYTGSCGGTLLGTGSPFAVTPGATTTYYARTRNTTTNCISDVCASVQVDVDPVAVAATSASASTAAFCSSNPPASISLSVPDGSGTTLEWFIGPCVGTPIGTGNPFNIAAPGDTTTYSARWTTVCGTTACVSTSVTVVPAPIVSAGSGSTICAGAVATLNGSASQTSGITWSGGAGAFGDIHSASTTYTAASNESGNVVLTLTAAGNSPCGPLDSTVTINVQPIPAAPGTSGNASICTGGAGTTLTATAGANEVVDWYTGSCSGSPAFTGNAFSVNPTTTTHYFAKARNTLAASCAGPCTEVVVTVIEPPTVSAGPSPTASACSGGPYPLSGSATNAASVLWSTSGSGTFAAAASAITTYTFSPADVLAGSVVLTLTAQPTTPCPLPAATSSITVTIEPRPSTSVVDLSYVGLPYGTVVTHPNHPGNYIVGCTAFGDIQSAINSVSGSDVYVGPGTFIGDLTISSHVNLHGAGPGITIISGAIGGPVATISYSGVINCELDGFTITREGNNTTDWNNAGLNSTAISFSGGAGPGCVVHDCEITGNRTGIDINNSSGATIRNNRIHFNRTALIMRNATDNLTITGNEITNNWTVGILFLDASSGSNVPVQSALNCTIRDNNISGNWYAQIVDRQSGGSIPAPGTTNLKNFSANWFGTLTPVISVANSAEPGYAGQIPVAYGGSATPPGGQPDICGSASANFDITPMLSAGADSNPGAYGFQGDFSDLTVTSLLAQTGSTGRVQEGNESLADGALIGPARVENVLAGTYLEKPTFSKSATILGANAGVDPCTGTRGAESIIMPDSGAATLAGTTYFVIVDANDITIDGLTIDGDNPALTSPFTANGANPDTDIGISAEAPKTADGLIVRYTIVKNIFQFGLALGSTGEAPRSGRVEHNRIDNIPYWAGVLVYDDYYAAIENNCINNAWRGVQTNNFYQPKPVGASSSISGNTITTQTQNITGDANYSDVDGILVNLHYANASDWTVSGNVITNSTLHGAGSHGIQVWSIQTATGVTCSNNTISSFDDGYFVWNCPTTNTVTISGGTTSGNNTGLLLANYQTSYLSAAPTTLLVSGVSSINNAAHGLAVDDDVLSSHAVAHMIVEGCTITGNAVGGVSMGGDMAQVTIRNASSTITGNAYGVYATKGGRVLLEDADLRSNSFAGIQIAGGTKVDAGDCSNSNFTGLGTGHGALGSSHGGNNLAGYGFDNFSPQAITNQSPNVAGNQTYAQNNLFGAGTNDDVNAVIFDHQDSPLFASVYASQAGGQGIATQPASQSACAGSNVTFSVIANGATHYQWFFGANPVGLDQSTLSIPGASLSNAGSYYVIVSDDCGNSTTSNTVTLVVQPGPTAAIGGPYSTCDTSPVIISGTAGNAASVLWTSSGTGTFVPPNAANSNYFPSAADVTAGSVTLTFHALPVSPCAVESTATATLTIQGQPTVAAGGPYTRCVGAGVFNVAGSSTNTSSVTWSTTGTGTFGDVNAAATTYTPSPADEAAGTIFLSLLGNPIAPCATTAGSTASITFQSGPTVTVGGPYSGCGGVPIAISGTAPGAASTLWSTSGSGVFADATSLSTTYTPSPADATAGSVSLTLTAQPVAPCPSTGSAVASVTISGTPSVVYVDDSYGATPAGTQVDWPLGAGGAMHTIGCDAFSTIQAGINRVATSGTVNVAAGSYPEDVAINKPAHVLGAGPGLSVVSGPIGGSINTFEIIGQPNVELAGFTITRAGNDVSTWNGALNNNGVVVSSSPGLSLHNNRFEGNRNALNMQFMNGASVHNNVITNNRTGLQCVDNVTSCSFTENEISNNWTVGVLFRDETPGGSNTTGTTFTNNTISGNWYGQIVYRVGTSPFTLKDFSGNYLGTTSPVTTTANSTEPGYAAHIPVIYGGTDAAPGGQPDIAGDGSGNVDITPMLTLSTDTSPTYGFQGDFSSLTVTSQLAQTGTLGRVQEGHDLVTVGGLVAVLPGTFTENVAITKGLTIDGAGAGDCDTAADPLTQTVVVSAAASTPVFDIVDVGGSSPVARLTLKDMQITGASGSNDGQSAGVRVSSAVGQTREFFRFENLTVTGNSGPGIGLGSLGTLNDVEVASSNLCSNYRGVVIDETLTAFSGLSISNSIVKNNVFHGLSVNGTANGSFIPTNISVASTVFTTNGQSNNFFQGSGDLSFFNFNGNASLTGVTVHTAGRVPVQFRGRGTDNFSIPWAPSGTITINGLTVDGVSDRSALYVHYYANVNGVSLNNVDLSGTSSSAAPFSAFGVPGMTLIHLGANPLPLGNTIFPCQGGQGAGYVGLALFGTGGASADCTTVFVGASTLAQKENCVFDFNDLATVGDVTFLDAAVTMDPSNTSACLGAPASFSITAVGPGLSYQWYHNNLSTPVGANSPTYSIAAVASGDAGIYFVVVTGACGSVTSGSASLSITPGPAPATSASSDTPAICTGSGPATITLTAVGGSGDTFTWYADSCGGSPIGTGTSIVIPAPLATTSYFGRWSTICGDSACVSTTVTHTAPPTANAGGSYTICAGGVVQLNGSSTNGASVQWSTNGDGFFHNALIPNAVYTPGPNDLTNGSVTLTFTVFPTSPCATPATSTALITINPLPVAPTSASTSDTNFCAGTVPTITLSAIGGSGAKLSWMSGTCGGVIAGSGPSITIAAPATTTTYFARWINGCGTSSCASVTVTVYDLPAAPSVGAGSAICSSQPATLSGSVGVGETIDWFDGGCGSGPVGSGTSIVVSPTVTTTYFARARNISTGCVSTGCQSVTITVTTTPTAPSGASVDASTYCSGSAPATIALSASGGTGGIYTWYSGSCGSSPVGTGSPLVISAPTSSTTYFVRREDGSCFSASCASVSVTVTPTPTAPASAAVDAPSFCSGAAPATISLSATGGVGGTYHWYSASCGSGPVGTGSPLVIAAPTSTTTYYVRREDGACFSPSCVSVTVTVNSSPVAPTSASVDQPSFCEGAFPTITLTAPGGSGDVLKWYSAACGGTPVGVGSPLVITSPIVSTTYFARWESILCGNSSCESVAVHVDPSAHAPTSITASANNYCAGSVTSLTLTAVAGSGSTLEWFDTACGGTVIGTGNPLVITAPITTTTYSARYVEPVCGPSTCASLIITVNPVTGACCTGWGTQKVCQVVAPINCQGVTTPTLAYRGNCTTCGTPFCCGADFNNNGHIEVQDIFDFLDAWFQQVQPSDFNHDGFKNVQDIFDFLSAWFAGC